MADADRPCCAALAEVLKGPGEGADPALFVDDDGVLTMVVATLQTPGGLGFFDRAVLFCPFCGTGLQTQDQINRKA
ncbi:hypothetical protein DLJ53_03735 [Acuticoccus sediminis]|uniref:Uncharacterized protein n=1 Tax=Acuticoccus sediminis TaxID=2184697 RepID=A0A8B2NY32_9HYPH|nr:hypothetical protein [Acuticoccus sediminis]RAI03610.1 hypothetical protein DLJ53_03735 [Acuticoccus sediminis]